MRSDTENRLVREWLSELDRELTKLPRHRAQELRAELTAHLAEVVPPDAPDAEVGKILAQLGDPAELVTEALGGSRPRSRLQRIRLRTWVLLAMVLALVIAGTTVSLVLTFRYAHAADLDTSVSGWVFGGDDVKFVDSQAGDQTQSTIPELASRRQGLLIWVTNQTGVTQTVLSLADGFDLWESVPHTVRLEISTEDPYRSNKTDMNLPYTTAPRAIKPGETRVLRITSITACVNSTAGGEVQFDTIPLRVRVGWFTRTEDISLLSVYAVKRMYHCSPMTQYPSK